MTNMYFERLVADLNLGKVSKSAAQQIQGAERRQDARRKPTAPRKVAPEFDWRNLQKDRTPKEGTTK